MIQVFPNRVQSYHCSWFQYLVSCITVDYDNWPRGMKKAWQYRMFHSLWYHGRHQLRRPVLGVDNEFLLSNPLSIAYSHEVVRLNEFYLCTKLTPNRFLLLKISLDMILVLTRDQVTMPWVWFDDEQLIIKLMTGENASDQPRISWKHSENNWRHYTGLCDVIVSRKVYRFLCLIR